MTWDTQRIALGDETEKAAVQEAERIFAEQQARGATAVLLADGQPPVRTKEFDPQAEQILIIPRVVGG
jgi:hypothetical protein